jgi:hemin uptake protein HemP
MRFSCGMAPKVPPDEGSATSWLRDSEWELSGVMIGTDHDPADAMNSPAKACTSRQLLKGQHSMLIHKKSMSVWKPT